jgi:hypothetical protein
LPLVGRKKGPFRNSLTTVISAKRYFCELDAFPQERAKRTGQVAFGTGLERRSTQMRAEMGVVAL